MSITNEVRTGGRKCPGCRSAQVRRSQMRGFWEHGVLRTVGVRAYRCESCDKRYYGLEGIEGKREKLRTEGERNR
jgi:hypothetical protein